MYYWLCLFLFTACFFYFLRQETVYVFLFQDLSSCIRCCTLTRKAADSIKLYYYSLGRLMSLDQIKNLGEGKKRERKKKTFFFFWSCCSFLFFFFVIVTIVICFFFSATLSILCNDNLFYNNHTISDKICVARIGTIGIPREKNLWGKEKKEEKKSASLLYFFFIFFYYFFVCDVVKKRSILGQYISLCQDGS